MTDQIDWAKKDADVLGGILKMYFEHGQCGGVDSAAGMIMKNHRHEIVQHYENKFKKSGWVGFQDVPPPNNVELIVYVPQYSDTLSLGVFTGLFYRKGACKGFYRNGSLFFSENMVDKWMTVPKPPKKEK